MRYKFYLYHKDLLQPVKLKHDPVGWDSNARTLSRDTKLHGVFFKYTPKLKFIKEGRAIIHTFYEQYGIEAEILIFIYVFNPVTRRYDKDYEGTLNLGPGSFEISTLYAECNIEATSFVQRLTNQADVKVNISDLVDLYGNDIAPFSTSTPIELPSKLLRQSFTTENIITGENENSEADYGVIISRESSGYVTAYYKPTFEPPLIDEIAERTDSGTNWSLLKPDENFLYQWVAKYGGLYTFKFDFNWRLYAATSDGNIRYVHWKLVTGVEGSYVSHEIGGVDDIGGDQYNHAEFNQFSISLNAGDEVYFYCEVKTLFPFDGHQSTHYTFTSRGLPFKVSVTADTIYPATNHTVVLVHELFARVLQSILGVDDPLRSSYYGRVDSSPNVYDADGPGSLRAVLSGFMLRQFPDKDVSVTLNELIDTFEAIDGIGIGVERINGKEYVVIEPLDYFYQPVEIMKLDYCLDITKAVPDGYYYNELECGYKDWNLGLGGELNNLDEFNSIRQFSLPITQVKDKLSLICPMIGGGYPIEYTRRDAYVKASTKDNNNDNNNFILQLRRAGAGFAVDHDEDFTQLDNIISRETVYNAKLSPIRNLIRNGGRIRSGLEKYKTQFLRLTYSEGNKSMISKLSDEAVSVDEGANILISNLPKPVFLPEVYKFKKNLTREQIDLMNSNKFGYVSFSSTNQAYKKAYILQADRSSTSNQVSFILLRANV